MIKEPTSLDQRIIEISNVIAFYAKRLTLMRGRDETEEALSRSYAYEFDKEIDAAKSILNLEAPAQHLADIMDHQSYWILTEPVLKALKGAKNVAVIGSGPLPLTALGVAEQTDAAVTCFELDKDAFDLGNNIIAHSPQKPNITCLNQLAEGGEVFEKFDAVISAVLLGVDLDSPNHIPKSETLKAFLSAVPDNAPVILRDPFRLGSLFYPAAQTDQLSNVDVNRFDPSAAIGEPYRSSFLILRTSS